MNIVIAVLLAIIALLLFDINNKLPRRDRVKEAVRAAMIRDLMQKEKQSASMADRNEEPF